MEAAARRQHCRACPGYRAVISARLRSGAASWKGNDLLDLNFLCCAAGYVNVVVGERRTIGDMRTARAVPEGAALACSLSEAVRVLDTGRAVGTCPDGRPRGWPRCRLSRKAESAGIWKPIGQCRGSAAVVSAGPGIVASAVTAMVMALLRRTRR
jgi:hypothetical protein